MWVRCRRDGALHGGRDPKKLSLGEWIFVTVKGAATHILNFSKFEPLVWTRVEGGASSSPR